MNKWKSGIFYLVLLALPCVASAQTNSKKAHKTPKTVTAEPVLTTPPQKDATLNTQTQNPPAPPPPDLTLPPEDLPKKPKVAIVPAPSPQNRDDVPPKTDNR